MGIIAGFLAQNFLKWALNFGQVSYLLNYNALSNFFTDTELSPNPSCSDENCIRCQEEFKKNKISKKKKKKEQEEKEKQEQTQPEEQQFQIINNTDDDNSTEGDNNN